MSQCKIVFRNLAGRTEWKHEESQRWVLWPRIEPIASLIQVRSVTSAVDFISQGRCVFFRGLGTEALTFM